MLVLRRDEEIFLGALLFSVLVRVHYDVLHGFCFEPYFLGVEVVNPGCLKCRLRWLSVLRGGADFIYLLGRLFLCNFARGFSGSSHKHFGYVCSRLDVHRFPYLNCLEGHTFELNVGKGSCESMVVNLFRLAGLRFFS